MAVFTTDWVKRCHTD